MLLLLTTSSFNIQDACQDLRIPEGAQQSQDRGGQRQEETLLHGQDTLRLEREGRHQVNSSHVPLNTLCVFMLYDFRADQRFFMKYLLYLFLFNIKWHVLIKNVLSKSSKLFLVFT